MSEKIIVINRTAMRLEVRNPITAESVFVEPKIRTRLDAKKFELYLPEGVKVVDRLHK